MYGRSVKAEKQHNLTMVRLRSSLWRWTLLNIIWHKNAPFIFWRYFSQNSFLLSFPCMEEKQRLVLVCILPNYLEPSGLFVTNFSPSFWYLYTLDTFSEFCLLLEMIFICPVCRWLFRDIKRCMFLPEYPHCQMPNLFPNPGVFTFWNTSFEWC